MAGREGQHASLREEEEGKVEQPARRMHVLLQAMCSAGKGLPRDSLAFQTLLFWEVPARCPLLALRSEEIGVLQAERARTI